MRERFVCKGVMRITRRDGNVSTKANFLPGYRTRRSGPMAPQDREIEGADVHR